MAGLLGIDYTMPKSYNLSKAPKGIRLITISRSWVSYTAKAICGCNGDVFEFSVSVMLKSSDVYSTVSLNGSFNTGSYGLYVDSTGVYLVCKNTSGVNDNFIISSTSQVEVLSSVDTTSMTDITPT